MNVATPRRGREFGSEKKNTSRYSTRLTLAEMAIPLIVSTRFPARRISYISMLSTIQMMGSVKNHDGTRLTRSSAEKSNQSFWPHR